MLSPWLILINSHNAAFLSLYGRNLCALWLVELCPQWVLRSEFLLSFGSSENFLFIGRCEQEEETRECVLIQTVWCWPVLLVVVGLFFCLSDRQVNLIRVHNVSSQTYSQLMFHLAGPQVVVFCFQRNMVSLKHKEHRELGSFDQWVAVVSWSQCGCAAPALCSRSAPQFLEIGTTCQELDTKPHREVWSIAIMSSCGEKGKHGGRLWAGNPALLQGSTSGVFLRQILVLKRGSHTWDTGVPWYTLV